MRVSFHRLADAELARIGRQYAAQGHADLQRFVAAIGDAADRIRANPAVGSPVHGPYRWVRAGRFRYVLYYRQLAPNFALVYAVAHTSRRPGYRLRRVNRP